MMGRKSIRLLSARRLLEVTGSNPSVPSGRVTKGLVEARTSKWEVTAVGGAQRVEKTAKNVGCRRSTIASSAGLTTPGMKRRPPRRAEQAVRSRSGRGHSLSFTTSTGSVRSLTSVVGSSS